MGRREPDPDWVTPEVKALQRAHWRRQAKIRKTLLPCPKCGCVELQVDTGLLDAPFEPGFETIYCPAVISGPGILEQSCGCSSQGAAAWNWRGPLVAKAEGQNAGR